MPCVGKIWNETGARVALSEAERAEEGGACPADDAADGVTAALRAILPGYTAAQAGMDWSALGLDSFDLLSLRLAIEDRIGAEISDKAWVAAATPAVLARLAAAAAARRIAPAQTGVTLQQRVELGMPQMALSGLSESWLLKALGDWHWRMIGEALETRPVDICDSFGNRLYPAFTRLRFRSSEPLAAYREGEQLRAEASLSRYGAAIFFSAVRIGGESGRAIEAELMSSFICRAQGGGNAQLQRAQPVLPEPCAAPAHVDMPDFGAEYARRRRSRDSARPVLARMPYAVMPQYDINGVGLLYYAAYPMIADICDMRRRPEGAAWAAGTSTIERDIFYFANADAGAALEWRLHGDPAGDGLATEASIVRDDGVAMAAVTTRKARL
jgi:probable biosynthetic protein (TIGR04098 family)